MFDVLITAFDVALEFFTSIYDAFFMDLPEFLESHSNIFTDWLLGIMEFTGLDLLLTDVTLFGFLFTPAVIVILIIYFFIP